MKTIVIGRETPGLTYAIFAAIAEKNAQEQRKRERIDRLMAPLRSLKRMLPERKPHWSETIYPSDT